jgi:hypothetical protein
MTQLVFIETHGGYFFNVPTAAAAADHIKQTRRFIFADTRQPLPEAHAWLVEVEPGGDGRPVFTVLARILYDAATDGPLLDPL